jgi:hypothetical protein
METKQGCTKIVQCYISVQRDYLHAGLDFGESENVQGDVQGEHVASIYTAKVRPLQ